MKHSLLYKGETLCYHKIMKKALIFNIQKFSLNDGPGIRTVVFFKGCPLRCRWCSNPESQDMDSDTSLLSTRFEAREMTVDEVLEICLQDKDFYDESGGGVTASGGEATVQSAFVSELFDRLHAYGVNTAMETSSFCDESAMDKLILRTDYFLMDIKHWDEEAHIRGTGVSCKRIHSNIKRAVAAGADVTLRIPVIPGYNSSTSDAAGFSELISGLGLSRVQLLPFHQFGESKYEKLGKEYSYRNVDALHESDMEELIAAFADKGIEAFL